MGPRPDAVRRALARRCGAVYLSSYRAPFQTSFEHCAGAFAGAWFMRSLRVCFCAGSAGRFPADSVCHVCALHLFGLHQSSASFWERMQIFPNLGLQLLALHMLHPWPQEAVNCICGMQLRRVGYVGVAVATACGVVAKAVSSLLIHCARFAPQC